MFPDISTSMVRVIETGKEECRCPRECGPLKYGRSLLVMQKTTHCKKCKGIMLTKDEVKKWEGKRTGPRENKMRKNNLFELLKSGTTGPLDCPKCSRKMKEIHLRYMKTRVMSRQEEFAKDPAQMGVQMIPIIGGLIQFAQMTGDLAGDLTQGKFEKSVTIDGCDACFIFWLDQGEIMQIIGNDLTPKSESNEI
jgi:Zn-finger nucleic acid-binding protein